MLVTKFCVFIHIPKTAGHFCKDIIERYTGPVQYMGEWHGPLSRLPEEFAHLPVVSFVRNPWDWYVSWYYHMIDKGHANPVIASAIKQGKVGFEDVLLHVFKSTRKGTNEAKQLDQYIASKEFTNKRTHPEIVDLNETMVQQMRDNKWGVLTWRYNFLLGDTSTKNIIFGRYEFLADDLISIIESLGVELSEQEKLSVTGSGPMNVGKSRSRRAYQEMYKGRALHNMIANREKKIIESFSYSFDN